LGGTTDFGQYFYYRYYRNVRWKIYEESKVIHIIAQNVDKQKHLNLLADALMKGFALFLNLLNNDSSSSGAAMKQQSHSLIT
jgi:hypothetical protein